MIEKLTVEQAGAVIDTRKPWGLFYALQNGVYIGIDNSHGHAWTEEFPSLRKCRRWLNNPDVLATSMEETEIQGYAVKWLHTLILLCRNEESSMAIVLTSTENMPYEEWLDWRKKGIGGSDASIVCGINCYKSPVELWMEKTNQLPYQEAGEAAYWGTQLEDLVRNEFTKRTGIEVKKVNQLLQSESHPFMFANLDGECSHPTYGTCVFEAKTASAYKLGEWDDAIPDAYALQIQHYMAVTGYRGTYIAVLIGGNTFRWKFVERDEELIALLIQLETDFWRHVQSMVPLPLDGSEASAKFLNERFPHSLPKSKLILPETASALIEQYETASEMIRWHSEQKQEAENKLKEMLGEHEFGTAGDWIVSWKSMSQERLDSKTFKAEHPKLYNKYANPTSYRRFSIKAMQ